MGFGQMHLIAACSTELPTGTMNVVVFQREIPINSLGTTRVAALSFAFRETRREMDLDPSQSY